jgi:uncharacterized Rmd1/YagE family protein
MNQTPDAGSNPSESSQLYRIKAIHIADKLKLKDLRERFTRPAHDFSNYEMIVRYADDSYMFLYNYGSAVFFNVPDELQERELGSIQEYRMPPNGSGRATDTFLVEALPSHKGGIKVSFDRIMVSSLSFQVIKIACMLLAESTALEYYEVLVEGLLERANIFSKKLQRQGRFLESTEDLVKFIGLCLDTKQEIISNLYIVDSPDETWENIELDKVHQELKVMMEIDTRYRGLEYKVKIIQESVEVIVDLSKSTRATLLELIIILLITFEIIISLVKWH